MNTKIYKYLESSKNTSRLNDALRDFIQNTQASFVLLYNEKTELPTLRDDELTSTCQKYEEVYEHTGIHYFAGKIRPLKMMDYGPVKVGYGSITEQKFILEFITRQAILECGYFDVRFTDSCRVGDYIYRLSERGLYPHQDNDKLPCVYDIEHNSSKDTAKHVFDELSSGWFNYKYKAFPQLKQTETLENVINSIKNYKHKIKNEQK
jgi:hypothetical protein